MAFVRLVDHMGDDASIVQAARVSYGQGTKTVSDDRGLIRDLMRHQHTTPFEMVEFKLFEQKMTKSTLAKLLEFSPSKVSEILSGKRKPDVVFLKGIHKLLKIDAEFLLTHS